MSAALVRRALSAVAVVAVAVALVVAGLSRHGTEPVHAADTTTTDTVDVVGSGAANGAPDTLNADFRVHVDGSTVQSAIDSEAAAAKQVLAALEKSGVARKHVQTTDLSIDERYNDHGVVIGYEASETLRARITPLRIAGRTISAAATAAGNNVSVDGLSFDIADDDPLVMQARAAAFADAKARAQQYADLAGRSLGRVISIRERIDRPSPTPYPYPFFAHAGAAKSAALPIRGGRQSLDVNVSVVWALS